MNFSSKRIYGLGFSALVIAGMIVSIHPAIAKPKPKPKPHQEHIEEGTTPTTTTTLTTTTTTTTTNTTVVSRTQIWNDLLAEIQNHNADVPTRLVEMLRLDITFRDQLFTLFWGQTGDRQTVIDILKDILLSQDSNEHDGISTSGHGNTTHESQTTVIHYKYVVDRACLPPGQRQRLDNGKPIPFGILKKCGHIRTVDS